jgi:general secretion pathway protein K
MKTPAPTPETAAAAGRQRGAALLLAMMILALVATTVAGMVWQQTRAVNLEAAERARAQSAWILNAALDWARLILREDQRGAQQNNQPYDTLGEPWAQPLAESRLSSFLAADKDNNADSDLEAFISGSIEDAQSRYNLRGLVDAEGKVVPAQLEALRALAQAAGAPSDTADRIAAALALAWGPQPMVGGPEYEQVPIKPEQVADLAWLGIDAATLARLTPFVELLPTATPVNINTAPREVLVAAIDGLDLGSAERIVQARARKGFTRLEEVQGLLATRTTLDPARAGVATSHFLVSGRLRLEDRILEERSLLVRRDNRVDVLRRERRSLSAALPR